MLFPVIVSAIAWLLTSRTAIQADLINIKSKIKLMLITKIQDIKCMVVFNNKLEIKELNEFKLELISNEYV